MLDYELRPRSRVSGSPISMCLRNILAKVGLEEPDGRPLYEYQMSDEDYERARFLLRTSALFDAGHVPTCALLVIYGAEWFRREAVDTNREWEQFGIVPPDLELQDRSSIAEAGIEWWNIELVRSVRGRELLLTIALHGGFPSRVLARGLRSWVTTYFRAVMADALAAPEPEAIAAASRRHRDHLRETFRYELIYDLATDLVSKLVRLRSCLPADLGPGEAIHHLDESQPDWRETLPLYLPRRVMGGEDTGTWLFGDLLTTDAVALDRSVNVRRLLRLRSADWVTGVVVGAEGELDPGVVQGAGEGRFEARLVGAVGALSPRPFAHLHLGVGDGGRVGLHSQPLQQRPMPIWNVPLAEAVRVALIRSDRAPLMIEWPGGRAVREGVSVWRPIPGRGEDFELAGLGSTRSAATPLLVLANDAMTATGPEGAVLKPLYRRDGQALWRVEDRTVLTDLRGERYRIEPSATINGDDRLDVHESHLPHLVPHDATLTLCHAPVRVRVAPNGISRPARAGELRFHVGGRTREWSARDTAPDTGRVSVAWRDVDGFVLDRRRLLVLPPDARIHARFLPGGGARVEWSGWRGWALNFDGGSADGEGGTTTLPNRSRDRFDAVLRDPLGRETRVVVGIEADRPRLVDGEGRLVRPGSEVDLIAMRSMLLHCPRREEIKFELVADTPVIATRKVEGTVPFQTFHELVTLLLGLSEWRGPFVRVGIMNGEPFCTIRRPQEQLAFEGRTVRPHAAGIMVGASTVAVVRPLLAPEREHELEPDGAGWRVPDRVKGPALVYLREGDTVLTRPTFGMVGHVDQAGLSDLQANAVLQDEAERALGLQGAYLRLIDSTTAGRDIERLRETAIGLRGLSPRAIDWVKALPRHPALLARMLFSASPNEVPALLQLERDLPFLWMTVRTKDWERAIRAELNQAIAALSCAFGDGASAMAIESMKGRTAAIVEQAPWFAGILKAMGIATKPDRTLHAIAQEHVRLHGEDPSRPPSLAPAVARARIAMPMEIGRLDHGYHTTLLAPLALAAAARGRVTLDARENWAARSALDADGDYVRAAFPHCLEILR